MKKTIFFLFILLYYNAISQNLVPNGDFENYKVTTDYFLDCAYPWYMDNSCSPGVRYLNADFPYGLYQEHSVPKNYWGFQYARSGKAYTSIWININDTIPMYNMRYYISVPLKHKLEKYKRYNVTYYVSKTEKWNLFGIDDFQAYCHKDSILNLNLSNGCNLCNYNPQVSNPRGNVITDTLNWIKISGSFRANGDERFLTIGAFSKDDSIKTKIIDSTSLSYFLTIYYIDDVSLYEDSTIADTAEAGNNKDICLGDSVVLGTHNLPDYKYAWYPKTYINDTSLANPTVKPHVTTTYYLKLCDFKYDYTYDSVTVRVFNCDTIKAFAGKDTILCKDDSIMLGNSANPLYQYAWQPPLYLNNQNISNPVSNPQSSINYVLSVKFLSVTVKDTVKLTVYNCDSVIAEAGKDTSICPNSSVQLGTQGNPLFKYSWQPAEYLSNANIANPLAVPLSTTIYYVTVKFLSRTAKDSVKITIKNCDTTEIEITIPNVITPNNDGRNDEFIITGLPEYSNLKIFNRWGKTIYESNNYQNNYNFLEVPDGTYYFILTTPKNKIYKGIITIVR